MMNERGFFTLVGLCLLLVIAILITGVQEFESNYSYGTTNFWAETALKNAADNALIEAIGNAEDLNPSEYVIVEIPVTQPKLERLERLENLNVQAFMQRQTFNQYKRSYPSLNAPKNNLIENSARTGKIFLVVASCDSNFVKGKVYRRTLAFVLEDDPNQTIHFVNDL